MAKLETLIPRFQAADRNTRLETLLDYSKKLRFHLERAAAATLADDLMRDTRDAGSNSDMVSS